VSVEQDSTGPAEWLSSRVDPAGARFRTYLAVAILCAASLGAWVAYRAAVVSSAAADLAQQEIQERVQQGQILAAKEGEVAQDRRVLGIYQAHVKAWKLLQTDADRMQARNPVRAASLHTQAQRELVIAKGLRSLLQFGTDLGDDKGDVGFDPGFVLQFLKGRDTELSSLRPEVTEHAVDRNHDRAVHLVGVVTVVVAAIFFLTLARIPYSKAWLNRLWAGAGYFALLFGLTLYGAVDVIRL
jgi:hypothetical protein